MNIASNKKNIILGSLGVLVVVGSLVFIGLGIKRSLEGENFRKKEEPNLTASNKSANGEKKMTTTTQSQDADKEGTSSIERTPTSTSEQEDPPPEILKEGSAVMRVPSEPAQAPDQEDIDQIIIEDSQCNPDRVDKRGRAGIVLEVTAEDQSYSFKVEGTNIEEDFQQEQTKTISFPAYFVDGEEISFQCQPLK